MKLSLSYLLLSSVAIVLCGLATLSYVMAQSPVQTVTACTSAQVATITTNGLVCTTPPNPSIANCATGHYLAGIPSGTPNCLPLTSSLWTKTASVIKPIPASATIETSGTVKAGSFLYRSDRRHKEQISRLQNTLTDIQQLNGYRFTFKDTQEEALGLIAQEVEEVFPELVTNDAEGYKHVDYAALVPVLLEALKEQQTQIEALQEVVAHLQG